MTIHAVSWLKLIPVSLLTALALSQPAMASRFTVVAGQQFSRSFRVPKPLNWRLVISGDSPALIELYDANDQFLFSDNFFPGQAVDIQGPDRIKRVRVSSHNTGGSSTIICGGRRTRGAVNHVTLQDPGSCSGGIVIYRQVNTCPTTPTPGFRVDNVGGCPVELHAWRGTGADCRGFRDDLLETLQPGQVSAEIREAVRFFEVRGRGLVGEENLEVTVFWID